MELNAHGCGVWRGHRLTNCKEALLAAIQHGFEHIEIDISRTADGAYVAGRDHGIAKLQSSDFLKHGAGTQIGTPMLFDDVVAVMGCHKDLFVMFDYHPGWEHDCPEDLQSLSQKIVQAGVESRCVLEAYSESDANTLSETLNPKSIIVAMGNRKGGNVPEPRIVARTVALCLKLGIGHVSASRDIVLRHQENIHELKDGGVAIWSCAREWNIYRNLREAAEIGIDVATVDDVIPGGFIKNVIWNAYNKAFRVGRRFKGRFCV